jgi:predicted dithiol-disulfide oxidoreductase (DUF899 family)
VAAKRSSRNAKVKRLLKDEIALRAFAEKVAAKRRALPPGDPVRDYELTDASGRKVKLSSLFGRGQDELLVYHYMFAPKDKKPCPMCTMWCDGYDRVEPYVKKRAQMVLVTKAPIQKLKAWAKGRGWKNIRLLSSHGSTFNRDFKVEDREQNQLPAISVFTKDRDGTVRHFYEKSAILNAKTNRGIDLLTPVWNLFDLLPSGRGEYFPNYEL